MKYSALFLMFCIAGLMAFAQSPQSFQYQSVVRDGNGDIVVNQSVSFQISLISGSPTGTVEYTETHAATTNGFGLVSLAIGEGTLVSGSFAGIDWSSAPHFIKVEVDITGGTSYVDMGTNQLLSVPYALNSKTSEDAFSGNYADLTGAPANVSQFANDAGYLSSFTEVDGDVTNELQVLSISNDTIYLSNGGIVKLPAGFSGNYSDLTGAPTNVSQFTNDAGYLNSFTEVDGDVTNELQLLSISNDTIYLTNGGFAKLPAGFSGNYSDLTGAPTNVSAFTNDVGYLTSFTEVDGDVTNELQVLSFSNDTLFLSSGGFVSLSGYSDTLWRRTGNNIYNTNTGKVGVGTNTPPAKLVVQGDASMADTVPLFEVKDRTGATVFIVYPDSARFYVCDDGSKTNKGAFAVSGRNTVKQPTNDFLLVTPDSSRVYTGDATSGFGVQQIGSGTNDSYMQLTPNNYFIGHEAGSSITSGLYNSFIGYQAGYSDTSGSNNYFIGYYSGYRNRSGYSNIFLGDNSGYSNIAGSKNVFIGDSCGFSNTTGAYNVFLGKNAGFMNNSGNNVFLGYECGKMNSSGSNNAFMGYQAGLSNTLGLNNVFIGNSCGRSNNTGNFNVFLGNEAGYSNTTGYANVYLGENAGRNSMTGTQNVFMGNLAGTNFISGNNNVFLGNEAAKSLTSGQQNVIIGNQAGCMSGTGDYNVFVGHQTGYKNNGGKKNVFIGHSAGYNNTTGENNIAMGEAANFNNQTGMYNVVIGFEAGWAAVSVSNCTYLGAGAGRNNVSISNTFIGNSAGHSNVNGMNNVALGLFAGMYSTGSSNVFIGNGAGTGNPIGPTGPATGNVFIGYGAGQNETGSNKLYISNSSTANPLIWGDFSIGVVTLNTVLKLTPGNAPATPTEGMIYSNSTDHRLYYYNGTIWKPLDN